MKYRLMYVHGAHHRTLCAVIDGVALGRRIARELHYIEVHHLNVALEVTRVA